MLEYLKIRNAGPAVLLELELAPRLNLLTGDNGLGKSFLLDVLWWVHTQHWPAEINRELTTGLPILPHATGHGEILYSDPEGDEYKYLFDRQIQEWGAKVSGFRSKDIVLYAQIDGSFALMDWQRNFQETKIVTFDGGRQRLSFPYVMTARQVWDGLEGDHGVLCNGLIRDWASWQRENGVAFESLKQVLRSVSPDADEVLEPGKLTRISPDDVRDIPTIKMPYGEVAVVHASAGVRRVLALAYLLVWAWEEHQRAAELRGLPVAKEIVFLIDEIDAHLHPRWQKTIVRSLLEVMKVLAPDVAVQLVAATHSPLVMASVEPYFDPETDAWFDLDLDRKTGAVTLEKQPWYRRGDADAWLKSEAFDQYSSYAPTTEEILKEAEALMATPEATREQAVEVDQKLRSQEGLGAQLDPFWVRWRIYLEDKGWQV